MQIYDAFGKNYLLNLTGIKWLPTVQFTWAKTITQYMTRTIMASMPDGKTAQHGWWANSHQMVRWVTNLSQSAPAELEPDSLLSWGWSPGPQSSIVQVTMSIYMSPKVGCWKSCIAIMEELTGS